MAEITDLDRMLRESFARLSEPGASDGVAEVIRSRVAAGDTGTAVATATAPGWGAAPGLLGTLGILGASALIVGGGIGAGAALFMPGDTTASAAVTIDADTVSAGFCPGGVGAAEFLAGEHVLVIARSDDSNHLAVRSSADWAMTVWLPTAVVVVEPDQAEVASLPVAGCTEPTLEAIAPEPSPAATEPPAPGPAPGPAPPPPPQPPPPPPSDTTAPTVGQPSANPNPVYNLDPVTITTTASDNLAVSSVTISWSGQYSGSAAMVKSGSSWVYVFTPPNDTPGTITFTVRANDAAGNQSTTKSVVVDHQYFG
ncbi:MAG: Ig-like domain-containing protein [Microcella sp.]|nr:Ig-like domain-containing protein [Microcella sp.]